MKNKKFFISLFFYNFLFAKEPEIIKVNSRIESDKYINNNKIQFRLDDYIGTWYNEKHEFSINKQLFFQYDTATTGNCKIIEETNNSILLLCDVFVHNKKEKNIYMILKLNYDFNFTTKNSADIFISMDLNKNKNCLFNEYKNYQKNCMNDYMIDISFTGYKNYDRL